MEWLESLILGVVQGITEFLPVSSDGHLAVTQQAFAWLTGNQRSGRADLFFDVMLHVGTLVAILVHYRKAIWEGVQGFVFNKADVAPGFDRASVLRVGLLAAVATSPLVPFALFFKDWVEGLFQSSTAAAVGFLITASVLALISFKLMGAEEGKGPSQTTWSDALLIGLAQMFAPLPGVSRSGLTIATALGLGFSRTWAVGFSLLIAVPAICGAAVFELKDALKDPEALGLTPDRVAQAVVATILAGLVGYLAILWLIRVVRAGRMWYFSVYLVALAVVVLGLVSAIGGGDVGSSPNAVDRAPGSLDPEPSAEPVTGLPLSALDRANAPRPRSDDPGLVLDFDSARSRASSPLLG